MESIRSIERKYAKMLLSYKDVNFKKRINNYVCSNCYHVTKTIDIDNGVTPFLAPCEKCGELAESTFYTDRIPERQPTQEWYRPDLKETIKFRKHHGELEHVLQGGLCKRKIKPAGEALSEAGTNQKMI